MRGCNTTKMTLHYTIQSIISGINYSFISQFQQLINARRSRDKLGQHLTADFPVHAFSPPYQSSGERQSISGEVSLTLVAILHNPVELQRSILLCVWSRFVCVCVSEEGVEAVSGSLMQFNAS